MGFNPLKYQKKTKMVFFFCILKVFLFGSSLICFFSPGFNGMFSGVDHAWPIAGGAAVGLGSI